MIANVFDVAIIGAGPVGLAAALEAKKQGLSTIIFEKGVIVNSIFNYPTFMTFFTTADLLEIGNHPFPSTARKPTRQTALDYYRKIVYNEELNVKQHHEVLEIVGNEGLFSLFVEQNKRGEIMEAQYKAKYIVVATGYYDNPKGLGGIPGENGMNVSYYYTEPHQYYDHDVVVVGAGNSGAEASLELWRHGARVTLIHNHTKPRSTIKYWVAPDLENRLKEGSIKGIMPAEVKEINEEGITIIYQKEELFIPADYIFILTGFTPNIKLFQRWDLEINKEDLSVNLTKNYESNRNGVFVVGSAGSGFATNKVFIENGREHAKIAIQEIRKRL